MHLSSASEVKSYENRGSGRYELKFTPDTFTVFCPKKTNRFSGIATSSQPKLYIVSVKDRPIYAGISKQSIRNRLRYGWSATGRGGYYGYSWRHQITSANLDVRCHVDAVDRCERDIETVEAEVVFLIRLAGQWPKSETEIHFYPSRRRHRDAAAGIMAHYNLSSM